MSYSLMLSTETLYTDPLPLLSLCLDSLSCVFILLVYTGLTQSHYDYVHRKRVKFFIWVIRFLAFNVMFL